MWDMNERRIFIEHGEPCRCRILDGAIYIAAPCRSVGHRVTKRRIAQLVHQLKKMTKQP